MHHRVGSARKEKNSLRLSFVFDRDDLDRSSETQVCSQRVFERANSLILEVEAKDMLMFNMS